MDDRLARLRAALKDFARERGWGRYHVPKNLAMAMSVEAAEVVEIFQWLTPAECEKLSPERRAHLEDELGDTAIYLLKLADYYGIDLIDAAARKLEKAKLKYPVEPGRKPTIPRRKA